MTEPDQLDRFVTHAADVTILPQTPTSATLAGSQSAMEDK